MGGLQSHPEARSKKGTNLSRLPVLSFTCAKWALWDTGAHAGPCQCRTLPQLHIQMATLMEMAPR